MRGRRKTKRVSRATDGHLRQVTLYRGESSSSQVRRGTQLAKIPRIEWNCAPMSCRTLICRFLSGLVSIIRYMGVSGHSLPISWAGFKLRSSWQVAVGEQSIEVRVQRLRELSVFEAVYPRAFAIPPNPTISPDASVSYDDARTPTIPLTRIRDEGPCSSSSSNTETPSIYLATLCYGTSSSNAKAPSIPLATICDEGPSSSSNAPNEISIYPQPPPKDTSLAQKHGEGSSKGKNCTRPDESMKPCIFFNTPMGCKRGADCPFRHGSSNKKMRMGKD